MRYSWWCNHVLTELCINLLVIDVCDDVPIGKCKKYNNILIKLIEYVCGIDDTHIYMYINTILTIG